MIYCHRGWVRVVYEDQGEPFVMHPGDCVLQPPGIRHRVLEA
jgi:quercetin dioxygenase-like cupin family protein